MLTFAIAIGATAGLGLLALKFPRVQTALAGFTVWAGLFIQVAGVIEAMRRVSVNPANAFTLRPGLPSVDMSGVTQQRTAGTRQNIPSSDMRKQQPIAVVDNTTAPNPIVLDQWEHNLNDMLDAQKVAELGPEFPRQVASVLNQFVHFKGEFKDWEANDADPNAQRALVLLNRLDELVNPTPVSTVTDAADPGRVYMPKEWST